MSTDPFLLPAGEHFATGSSDMSFFDNYTGRCSAGALMVCRSGSADLTIDDFRGSVRRHMAVFLFPESLFSIVGRSDDFRVDYFVFSHALFAEAAFPLDVDFMRIVKTHPFSKLTEEDVSAMNIWFASIAYDIERGGKFRNTIVKNRLQNAMMEAYDMVMRHADRPEERSESSSRQHELYGRFISLVKQHYRTEREVSYYAAKLCVSTRYLSTISRTVSGRSAKMQIDYMVILEIKLLLQNTTLSVQEIAYRLHFPDQSYLGRFFRKHTGISPSQFRKTGK